MEDPIHDLGHSTPIVWGDQVWLTTATEDGRTLYAVCIDLNSGEIVYDVEVFHPNQPQRIHPQNSYATPSAVVEEGRAYVHFGTFGTACLNSETGEVVRGSGASVLVADTVLPYCMPITGYTLVVSRGKPR